MEFRLLVVEDDTFLRDGLLRSCHGREGYIADYAGSRREARQLLSENSYRLIILDIMSPTVAVSTFARTGAVVAWAHRSFFLPLRTKKYRSCAVLTLAVMIM